MFAIAGADNPWLGADDALLGSQDPVSLQAAPDNHGAILVRVRRDCFMAGVQSGHLVEFADASFQCGFPDGSLIVCPAELRCTISGLSWVTAPYHPSPDRHGRAASFPLSSMQRRGA